MKHALKHGTMHYKHSHLEKPYACKRKQNHCKTQTYTLKQTTGIAAQEKYSGGCTTAAHPYLVLLMTTATLAEGQLCHTADGRATKQLTLLVLDGQGNCQFQTQENNVNDITEFNGRNHTTADVQEGIWHTKASRT